MSFFLFANARMGLPYFAQGSFGGRAMPPNGRGGRKHGRPLLLKPPCELKAAGSKSTGGAPPVYISRPTTWAMARAFSITAAKRSGFRLWAPSLQAFSGQGCTSMIRPSAPAATAARLMLST